MGQNGTSCGRGRRGGARPGAGRKKGKGRTRTPHRARPALDSAHPVHVTMRARTKSLRKQQMIHTVLGAFRDSNRSDFRIAQYSIQGNHLHLIVESSDEVRLSSGMRGLAVRLAKRINKLLFRSGQFWDHRWHGSILETARKVRNALVYVLQNRKKHAPRDRRATPLDPLSSAEWFDGFATDRPGDFHSVGPPCIANAETWLLCIGWKKLGLIYLTERPSTRSAR